MRYALKLIAVIALTLNLSSCGIIPSQAKLPLPEPETYPTIKAEKLECLDIETFKALAIRDTMKSSRIETLEAIIRKTH